MSEKLKISIIIPTFNSEEYVEETIKSVINQNYSNLDLILVDGNSTDRTMRIVEKYKEYFSHIVSEADNGQYDAINKGFNLAVGDIFAYLNSDDIYFPWTLNTVNHIFSSFSDINWISGIPAFNDEKNNVNFYNTISSRHQDAIKNGAFRKNVYGYLQQESMFWRKKLWVKCGGFGEKYNLANDFHMWTKFAAETKLVSVGSYLAAFRKHKKNRSVELHKIYNQEVQKIIKSKKRTYFLIQSISKHSNIINKLIRLLIWKKAAIVFYSHRKNKWCFQTKLRPISNNSLTKLILEKE